MRILDHAVAEGAHAELHEGAVVEDLGGNVGKVDGLLQVAHHHQVVGLEPSGGRGEGGREGGRECMNE